MFDGLQEIRKSPLSAVTWLKSVLSLCTKQLSRSQITYRLQLNVLQKKTNRKHVPMPQVAATTSFAEVSSFCTKEYIDKVWTQKMMGGKGNAGP